MDFNFHIWKSSIEHNLHCFAEFYLTIGSTFSLFPEITFSRVNGEAAIDFLWFHIGFSWLPLSMMTGGTNEYHQDNTGAPF